MEKVSASFRKTVKGIGNPKALLHPSEWKIPPQPGALSNSMRWSNHDLDPIEPKRRVWTKKDFIFYWMSDQFITPVWLIGSTLAGLGFTMREAIPLTFFGFLLTGCVLYLNGFVGAYYRTPFPVYARTSWGYYGAYFPIICRTILALFWLAILTYQCGVIVEQMLIAIWPSFRHFPNHFPESAGVTSAGLIGIMVYWAIQTPISLIPVHKLKYFFLLKTIVSPITFIAMGIWGLSQAPTGPLINGPVTVTSMSKGLAVCTGLNAVNSLWATFSVNVSDFSRFSKENKFQWWQGLVFAVSGTVPVICAMATANACEVVYGSTVFAPNDVLALWGNRGAVFFCGVGWLIASVAGNISANAISFATDFTALFPTYFNIRRACLAGGLISILMCPWKIVANATQFVNFLGAYGCYMGPIAGVMIADFWIVRKRVLDIREVYNASPSGAYWFDYGVNWRAVVAFFIGWGPNIPDFAHAINSTGVKSTNPYTYSLSWIFGLIVSLVSYSVISKVFPPTKSLSYSEVHVEDVLQYDEDGNVMQTEHGIIEGVDMKPSGSMDKEAAIVNAKLANA
ncbi:hypothetical protein YB2330_006074 [Saitoella coloradoensis]